MKVQKSEADEPVEVTTMVMVSVIDGTTRVAKSIIPVEKAKQLIDEMLKSAME